MDFLKASTRSSSGKQTRPNSAGTTRRPAGSGYASNHPTTNFFSAGGADRSRPRSHSNTRPSSSGMNRTTDNMKKRTIWTPNGIQTQYVEVKESSNHTGYARPKSAGVTSRSKSGGGSSKGGEDPTKAIPSPIPTRQTTTDHGHYTASGGADYRMAASYRLHYGLAAALNRDGQVESEKQRLSNSSSSGNRSSQQQPIMSTGEAGTSSGVDTSTFNRPTSASSRIRTAINLGQQYDVQVATRTQAVEAAAAIGREKTAIVVIAPTGGVVSSRGTELSAPVNTKTTSAAVTATTTSASAAPIDDDIPINDEEDNEDDEEYDHMGEGRETDGGGLGTDDYALRHGGYESRSSAPSHPEVSTPSASLELGEKSSMSGAAHVSAELRNMSSMEEGVDYPHLSTLPNQFCSMKEASELQKIILSCSRHKSRPTAGPASTVLMDMYMVGKVVGVGSYGKVRAAWHRLTSSKVAIKTYDKGKLKDPEHWKRVQVWLLHTL